MNITAIHINYYFVCHRKLWLFANGISMEHTSDAVFEGKLIHETSYPQRSEKYKEIQIGNIKLDHYDAKNKVVHEIKKSNKMETAHLWQLKYYLYILEQAGIEGATGILEYPKLRKTEEVLLSRLDVSELEQIEKSVETIINQPDCPKLIEMPICKSCSYFEFCFA